MRVFEFNEQNRISAEKRKELMREYGEKRYEPNRVYYLFENPTAMPKLRLFVVSENSPNRIKFLDNGQIIEYGEGRVYEGDDGYYMNKGLFEKFGYVDDLEKDRLEIERNGHFFKNAYHIVKYGLSADKVGGLINRKHPLNKVSLEGVVAATLKKEHQNQANLDAINEINGQYSEEAYLSKFMSDRYPLERLLEDVQAAGVSQEEIAIIQQTAEFKFNRRNKYVQSSAMEKKKEDYIKEELAQLLAEETAQATSGLANSEKNRRVKKIDWAEKHIEDGRAPYDFWRVADYVKYQDMVNENLQEYWPAPVLYKEHDLKHTAQSQDFKF